MLQLKRGTSVIAVLAQHKFNCWVSAHEMPSITLGYNGQSAITDTIPVLWAVIMTVA